MRHGFLTFACFYSKFIILTEITANPFVKLMFTPSEVKGITSLLCPEATGHISTENINKPRHCISLSVPMAALPALAETLRKDPHDFKSFVVKHRI